MTNVFFVVACFTKLYIYMSAFIIISVVLVTGPALGMGRGGLSPPKRLSCPPNQNVGKDSMTHFYDLCID